MFTDMVGYTALMREDEGRAKAFRDRQRLVLEEEVAEHGGRIGQFYGDGTLSSFPSAVEAAQAAIRIQTRLSEAPRIPLRIGIHLGDVLKDDHGVLGDGVNVAARVQSLAIPGSVLISDRLQEELANHPHLPTTSLGRVRLKGVPRRMEVFALQGPGLATPNPASLAGTTPEEPSVAVLPFVNMSSEPDNEFFADGITEEIINALTRVEGVRVTARTSSFAFKGQNRDIRSIAAELGVGTVLEGSVRRAGERVRITAQLIEAETGWHLFSEVYDGSLDDIFATQDEIAAAIVARLESHFGAAPDARRPGADAPAPPAPGHHIHTQDPEAFTEYLKGRYHWNRWTERDGLLAIEHLERSAEIDPGCALPFSALANVYTFMASVGRMEPSEAYPRAAAFARHALEVEPEAGEGFLALGMVKLFYDWDFEGARENIEMALERIPGSADARQAHSLYLKVVGRHAESVEAARTAVRLDPLSMPANRTLAVALLAADKTDEALEVTDRILSLDDKFLPGIEAAGFIHWARGDRQTALELWESVPEISGDPTMGLGVRGFALARMGRLKEAREILEALEEVCSREPAPGRHNDFALVYWGLGDLERTFYHLGQAVDRRMGSMIFLATSPNWRPLRHDPRFQALVDRIGIPVAVHAPA
jgi:TolB-like protein/tetratricopeptide (TPR) repeat protein